MPDPILEDFLDDLEQWLKELDELLDNAPDTSDSECQQAIATSLNDVESNINQVFNPQQLPVLSPNDAGSIDTSHSPTSLRQYSATSVALATQARSSSDHEEIGSCLKTILHLLPGFRTAAGL